MTTLITTGSVRASVEADTAAREKKLLCEALEELNVSGHRLWMVEHMLELVEDASEQQVRAARIIVTALVLAIARGSTGLPVERRGHSVGLREELDLLLATARSVDEEGEGLAFESEELLECFFDDYGSGTGGFAVVEELAPLVGDEHAYKPVILDQDVLYIHKTAAMERSVAERFEELLQELDKLDDDVLDECIEAVLATMPFPMSDPAERAEKKGVLTTVLPRRLGVITGGAGSGKTTVIFALLRVLHRLDEQHGGLEPASIALAAPTGKAAKRMGESIEDQFVKIRDEHGEDLPVVDLVEGLEEPRTLHRLLEYSPHRRGFRRGADNPLDEKLVVVDEASMVDLELMKALVEALPEDGRLVLVGDAGQLPSVQAGAVFHDLTRGDETVSHAVRGVYALQGNYRQAKQEGAEKIVNVANEVRGGEGALDDLARRDLLDVSNRVTKAAGVHFIEEELPFEAERHLLSKQTESFVEQWWETHYGFLEHGGEGGAKPPVDYRSETIFEHTEDGGFTEEAREKLERLFGNLAAAQVLCVTRRDARGSERINRRMHRRYVENNPISERDAARFSRGEPVIVTRNDYESNVFNGEQGVVLYTRRPDEQGGTDQRAKKRVVFKEGDSFRAVSFGRLRDKLEHAYALTVHKSQGSEYDHVAVILPELSEAPGDGEPFVHPLVTREILYTALTRAKLSATIYGRRRVFDRGVARGAGRYSGIRRRLHDASHGCSNEPEEDGERTPNSEEAFDS